MSLLQARETALFRGLFLIEKMNDYFAELKVTRLLENERRYYFGWRRGTRRSMY